MKIKVNNILASLMFLSLCSAPAMADGIVVDKVYHPYVIANEREVEWRLLSSQTESV
jgi:hypothetical protein